MGKKIKCKNGHKYDSKKYAHCPACGVDVDLGLIKNFQKNQNEVIRKKKSLTEEKPKHKSSLNESNTISIQENVETVAFTEEDKTILIDDLLDYENSNSYLYGWLVGVNGVIKNIDYRFENRTNTFGIDFEGNLSFDSAGKLLAVKYFSLTPDLNKIQITKLGTDEVYVNGNSIGQLGHMSDTDKLQVADYEFVIQVFKGGIFKWRSCLNL